MNFGVLRFLNTTARTDVTLPVSERIQKRVRRPDPEQLNWELNLRLEEREKERRRIARELHDTLFQGFVSASMILHCAAEEMPPDSPAKPSVSRALRLIQSVMEEARVALQGLRSSRPPSTSLEMALSELRDEFITAARNVDFRILVNGRPQPLPPAIHDQVYLIAREATINALRHSRATRIEAEIEYLSRQLRLLIRDNGCGIKPQVLESGRPLHFGLRGMQERAAVIGAKLRISSKPGAGTQVEVTVPADLAVA